MKVRDVADVKEAVLLLFSFGGEFIRVIKFAVKS